MKNGQLNISRWLIAAIASVLSLLLLLYIAKFHPTFTIGVATGLVIFVILAYEPLLRAFQNISGNVASTNDPVFFEVIIELNRKFQNLLNIEDVLFVLQRVLLEKAGFKDCVFLLSHKLLFGSDNAEGEYEWYKWGGSKENLPVEFEGFEDAFDNTKRVFYSDKSNGLHCKLLDHYECNIALPITLGNRIACLVLLNKKSFIHLDDNYEQQMYSYLANQLSLVLDRVRIYEKVMLRTQLDHAEKLQVMKSLSANIAHEMRTPLSGIRASITGIEKYLPTLLKSYDYEIFHNEDVNEIHKAHLQSLQSTPNRIKLMIDQANSVIDMLLINLRGGSQEVLVNCSARTCIKNAVERYPFKSGEREKIFLYLNNDFTFKGVEVLFVYVIFNLLKNSLYSIRAAHKGEIEISLESKADWNYVIFRDTGGGMEPEVLDNIFENFYTTKDEGTGVGLTFCKRTIINFNGDIECESQSGLYTEFKIKLPCIKGSAELNELFH